MNHFELTVSDLYSLNNLLTDLDSKCTVSMVTNMDLFTNTIKHHFVKIGFKTQENLEY